MEKFKLTIPTPALPPTEKEEQVKHDLIEQIKKGAEKNCTQLLKYIEAFLVFKQMKQSHVAYLSGKDKIVIKRVFKSHTIIEIVKNTTPETDSTSLEVMKQKFIN